MVAIETNEVVQIDLESFFVMASRELGSTFKNYAKLLH